VIGSNAGRDRDPAWVGNLRAHPDVRVRVARDVRSMRARETEGEERDRLWAAASRDYPGFDDYASWTTRRIPVIVLEPVAAGVAA
jgi:deazaflavin-dependent oxidoreductase (nitroreductase family)